MMPHRAATGEAWLYPLAVPPNTPRMAWCFRRWFAGILAAASVMLGAAAVVAQTAPEAVDSQGETVVVLTVDAPIGPATAGYVTDGIRAAADDGAGLVVLRLNTPGGLTRSMRAIIDRILKTPVPVATYVAPTGARAASAGTYIMYASHIAAMAPGTTMGAATPIQMGGGGDSQPPESGDGGGETDTTSEDKQAPDNATAKRAKAVNDAVAYIRALADLRGRNADWAERAVREAATLTAEDAVAKNAADLTAGGVPALLTAVDGRTVKVGEREVTLATKEAAVDERPMTWRDELLATITDPNIAFIFMMLGVYGLIFELSNPGAIFPGVIGAICLLIGLYAMSVLPVSVTGLALLVVGIGFMVGEAFVPAFGALGLGGLAAFALGATMLFETDSPAFALNIETVIGVTALTGAVLVLLVGYIVRSQRRAPATGQSTVVGRDATVDGWSGTRGRVVLDGEYWNARGPAGLAGGQTVHITDVDGLTLTVEATASSQTAGATS